MGRQYINYLEDHDHVELHEVIQDIMTNDEQQSVRSTL